MKSDLSFLSRCLLGLACCAVLMPAGAAQLTVYSAGAARSALVEIVQQYQTSSGHSVQVDYAPVGTLMKRLAEGAHPDLVILTVDVMGEAQIHAWVQNGSATPIGQVGVGVAVQDGKTLPDISTPAALKQALLAAKSITYMDPTKGTSGKHFAEVLRKLEIADAVKAKTTLGDAGFVVEPVARGEIELGIQQITEILPVKGARLVGPLPDSLQKTTVYAAALGTQGANPGVARDFLAYLTTPAAREWFISKGFATPAGSAAEALSEAQIAQLVASPDRSAADRRNDQRRKPEQMLAFIGVRPGMLALDLSAAGGYTTELLARAVGPTGHAYGQSAPLTAPNTPVRAPAAPEGNANPSAAPAAPVPAASAPAVRRSSAQALAERAQSAQLPQLSAVVRPFEDPIPPEVAAKGLDLVTLMFNYHDLGHMGVDRASLNRAVFAALKPGGLYVIADHAGRSGTGISESGTLHRIEEAFLRTEVQTAGFRLAASADFLRNPNDPRDKNTPEPPQPKDEFVLKFVKP